MTTSNFKLHSLKINQLYDQVKFKSALKKISFNQI
jgi:hypothetical protein